MRTLLALLLTTTLASAADMSLKAPPPMAPSSLPAWTGWYFGANVGYGANVTDATAVVGTTTLDLGAVARGPAIGGQIGYDWQPATNWVLGLRGGVDFANFRANGNVGGVVSLSNLTNYIGDFDLRLGYSGFGNHVLTYVNGGLGFGGRQPNFQVATLQAAANDTSVGWNVGGGIETGLTPYVSAFGEIDYYDLGSKSLQLQDLSTAFTPLRFGVAKVGLNLRMN
jgi:outer membrane immunogenic protein